MLYDLTQAVETGMTFFPGDPKPRISAWPVEAPWRVSEIHIGSHCGTHIDAPAHLSAGQTIDQLPLERFIGRGVVLDVGGKRPRQPITMDDLGTGREALLQGTWAVFRTGWSRHWWTDSYFNHPYLDPSLARALVAWGVTLIALDVLNPDDTTGGDSVVHETLLHAGTLIVENLTNLEQLAAGRIYTFSFLPLRLTGLDGSPVRAVAWDTAAPV